MIDQNHSNIWYKTDKLLDLCDQFSYNSNLSRISLKQNGKSSSLHFCVGSHFGCGKNIFKLTTISHQSYAKRLFWFCWIRWKVTAVNIATGISSERFGGNRIKVCHKNPKNRSDFNAKSWISIFQPPNFLFLLFQALADMRISK